MDINYLKPLLEKRVNELGFELCSISSKKEAGTLLLSIVVDRVNPIDMETISNVSNNISSYLDEIELSNEPYTLDVSSLGAEKPLKIESLKSYEGSFVNVHIINPIEGMNIFEGDMIEANDETIAVSYKIKTRVKKVVILQSNIYKIRLAIKF